MSRERKDISEWDKIVNMVKLIMLGGFEGKKPVLFGAFVLKFVPTSNKEEFERAIGWR